MTRPAKRPQRHVFLARFEENLRDAQGVHAFSAAHYPELYSPRGFEALESFELAPHPVATYALGPLSVRREILMARSTRAVLCRYTVQGAAPGESLELELRPLLAYREADALTFQNPELDTGTTPLERGFSVRPYAELPSLGITWCAGSPAGRFDADPLWYKNIEYTEDQRRGYDGREDQFSPGVLHLPLEPGRPVVVAAALDGAVPDPAALWEREAGERRPASPEAAADFAGRQAVAAEQFLYEDDGGRAGVIAGYPWFGEWGRDTFIALPGLTLARGELDRCAAVLSGARPFLRDGLLPNIYGADVGDSHYGSADAALWFARAVRLYQRAGGPRERVLDEYLPALESIAEAYLDGTALSIAADESGLVRAGDPSLNATWMDARTSQGAVTPRDGFAVELCALWYALLEHLEQLHLLRGELTVKRRWTERRRRAKRGFLERFWLEDERYLADLWQDGEPDPSVRPNMVIAASLEFSPLTRAQRAGVVERARGELLTPRGLRTLSPWHPDYRGRYGGDAEQRDRAYHQGTAWPWLLGFYCEAAVRAGARSRAQRDELRALWADFEAEEGRHGLGHLSEVFDGDPPHQPGGTFAQAWNTAELLRSLALLSRGRP